jgi:hypothetical protein
MLPYENKSRKDYIPHLDSRLRGNDGVLANLSPESETLPRALIVRAGGVILAFSEGILGDFGLKSGESAENLPKVLDFHSASG